MPSFIGDETAAEREERVAAEAAAAAKKAEAKAAAVAEAKDAADAAKRKVEKPDPVPSPSAYGAQYTDRAVAAADKASEQTPFLGAEGKQLAQTTGGAAQLTSGIFQGKKADIKEGAKNLGQGVWSAVTAAPLRSLNKPPPPSYSGGSQDALAANRAQYDAGILAGQDQNLRGEGLSMYGAEVANTAAQMGAGTYDASQGLYGAGMATAMTGMGGQTSALDASIAAANRNVGSIAEAQQRMANDTQARQMAGLAASARGGNQAAAMRNANAQSSQNALVNNQQIGMMRLKEEQDLRASQTQAQQFAASQYGDRAALGYGTATSGLGAANTATGQVNTAGSTIGGIGSNIMGSGSDATKTFTDAELRQNEAQLKADAEHESAKKASKGGVKNIVSNIIGMV